MTKLLRNILPIALVSVLVVSGPTSSQAAEPKIDETAINAARAIASGDGEILQAPAGRIETGTPAPEIILRDPEPITPPPERHLNVMLDWYLNPYHAPLIVAQERGLFARAGLEVTLTIPADPSVPPKLVAAQRTELAITSQPRLHLLVDEGLPLIRVGTLVPVPLGALLVREDSDITSLSELKGKTVGYALEGQARILLDGMLTNQPVSPEDVTLEPIDFALSSSLVEEKVDAVIGALRHVDLRQITQEGVTAVEFAAEEHGVPLYDEMILIANRNVLQQHRRDIANFLDALQSATLWLINHPEQAWELVRSARPSLDTEANAQAWTEVLRYLALRPAVLQERRYEQFEAYLHQRDLVETFTPVKRLATELDNP